MLPHLFLWEPTSVSALLLDPPSGDWGGRLHLDGPKATFLIKNMGQLAAAAWRTVTKKRKELPEKEQEEPGSINCK